MDHGPREHVEFIARLLGAVYGITPRQLEALPESDPDSGEAGWRVDGDAGPVAVVRAYRDGYQPPEHFRYFYPWACPGAGCEVAEWLPSRAATLLALAAADYTAPHILRTMSGAPVGVWEGWHVLATRFVAGEVLRPTAKQLRQLGETLGRLHALRLDLAKAMPQPGLSYWAPRYAIPSARAKLTAVAGLLPDDWCSLHEGMGAAVEGIGGRVERGELPETIIHGDAWAANAVQTPSGAVVLIDWEQGGLGPAVLDLARLLLECHLNSDTPPGEPLAWHIQPDPARIAAVVDGYARARMPAPAELDTLLDGLRFGTAFIGALHFEQALLRPQDDAGWRAGMQRRYERLRNRFAVSEAVAQIAHARFRELLP
jgi:Ser/Thr protein kinase RdoA (MazF antagonist)